MGRQLASYGNTTYTYNEAGIRTRKTANNVTTQYYLDGTNIIAQTDGTNTFFFRYDSNDEIVGLTYLGADYFYVKNQTGDITGISDANGNLIAEYEYDPWGAVISVTGSNTALANANPFRYRSYYYDSDTGMYYLQSRYYDPEICRFINADVANNYLLCNNAFCYCENNPVLYCDYLGYLTNGQIHNIVVNYIYEKYGPKSKYGYSLNIHTVKILYSNGKYGYCDIIDTSTGEIWEVKKDTYTDGWRYRNAITQLYNYTHGLYVDRPSLTLKVGGMKIVRAIEAFEKEGYSFYTWNNGDGLIFYHVEKIKNDNNYNYNYDYNYNTNSAYYLVVIIILIIISVITGIPVTVPA